MNNNLKIITNELILDFLDMKYKISTSSLRQIPIKRMVLFNPERCDICKVVKQGQCNQHYLTPYHGCVMCNTCSLRRKSKMVLYALSIRHAIIPWKHFIPLFNSVTTIDFDAYYNVKRSDGSIEKWKVNTYDDAPWFSPTTVYIPMKSDIKEVGKSITLKEFIKLNNIDNAGEIIKAFESVYL